jgi:GntR family transcriptional repressor for pyruvate dehydrogenase complex
MKARDSLMDKEHLHNKVVKEVIAMVASGACARGQRLPAERTLCGQFGVSRGTLRKALAKLVELEIVSIKPNSGIYVRKAKPAAVPQTFLPPDFENVNLGDILQARKAIELAAVELACRRAGRGQIKALRDSLKGMATSLDDLPAFLQADMAFHQQLVQAGGNRVLVTAFQAIYEYHRFQTILTSQKDEEERLALGFHRRILAAVEKRNVPAARRILAEHLDYMNRYTRKTGGNHRPPRKRTRL